MNIPVWFLDISSSFKTGQSHLQDSDTDSGIETWCGFVGAIVYGISSFCPDSDWGSFCED